MRELTFAGFTARYVSGLSSSGRSAIYPLAREAIAGNARLKAPLYLFALTNGRVDTLLRAVKNTSLYAEYKRLADRHTAETFVQALAHRSETLATEYQKVWDSYVSVATMHERDERVKQMIRKRVLELQKQCSVSTYRLCKDQDLNVSNVNAWLKHGASSKVSLDKARNILAYLEQHQKQMTQQ